MTNKHVHWGLRTSNNHSLYYATYHTRLGSQPEVRTLQIACSSAAVASGSFRGDMRCRNTLPSLPTSPTKTPAPGSSMPAPLEAPVFSLRV